MYDVRLLRYHVFDTRVTGDRETQTTFPLPFSYVSSDGPCPREPYPVLGWTPTPNPPNLTKGLPVP